MENWQRKYNKAPLIKKPALSGKANLHVMFGSPTGTHNGDNSLKQHAEAVATFQPKGQKGGRRRRRRGGQMVIQPVIPKSFTANI